MSLLVWLPLTQNNSNQGLLNLTPTNQGTISFIDGGKLGKCLSAGNSSQTANGISYNSTLVNELGTKFSASIWVKPLGNHVHYNGTFVSSGDWNAKRWSFGVSQNNTQVDVFGNGHNKYVNCTVPVNQWTHLVCTNDNGTVKLYKNGEYVTTTIITAGLTSDAGGNFTVGRETYANGYFSFNGNINDLRIYNHILSEKEIKELAKGLAVHYPLSNISNQTSNIVNTSPTFDTSAAAGGWNHWGATGNKGSYGQTTDKNYIYNKNQTYAHWVANGNDATAYYIVYQSPAFESGYRSMYAIIKEQNGAEITNSICYPGWNAHTGSHPQNKWDKIYSLGDGFYLCKVEGFQQDGSNDLVCIHVPVGQKIYISECYIENDRTICSDFLYPSNTVYDTSGNGYNGTKSGTLTNSSNTSRNSICTTFASGSHIAATINPTGYTNSYTFSWWGKYTNYSGHMMWGFANGNRLNLYMASGNFYWNTGDGSNNPFNVSAATYGDGNWHHFAISGDGTTTKLYIDGEFKANAKTYKGVTGTSLYFNGWDSSTSYNFSGSLSDFRLYSTVLSAEDIKELYQSFVSIDKNGNLFAYEFVEV